jgi:hypothetical protein
MPLMGSPVDRNELAVLPDEKDAVLVDEALVELPRSDELVAVLELDVVMIFVVGEVEVKGTVDEVAVDEVAVDEVVVDEVVLEEIAIILTGRE